MAKLTVLALDRDKKFRSPGRYTDGRGLHLHVRPGGHRSWVLRYMRAGKSRDMGLGVYPDVGLAEARDKAEAARKLLRDKQDPLDARRAEDAQQGGRTFKEAAERLVKDRKAGWSNGKHTWQWSATLEAHAYPVIGDLHVQQVTTEHVLRILRPIWTTKNVTASRLRNRIEAVLDAARAMHWREGENPARWKGHLAAVLPAPNKVQKVEHRPSLPWRQVPAFLAALADRVGSGARAVEFAILTAARSGEVRGLRRRELDLDAKVWTVPRDRMKGRKVHRVPLSAAALAMLDRVHVADLAPDDFVFPGDKPGTAPSDMTLTAVVRRMNQVKEGQTAPWLDGVTGEPITVHGFRSTFRVWAGEETDHPREVVEAALAHVIGGTVEQAYARTDLLEKRRALMEAWADQVSGTGPTRPKG